MGWPGRTPDVLRSHPPLADRLLTVRHPCHACAQRLRSARASPVLHACALPHSPPDESRHSLRQRLRNPCPPPPFDQRPVHLDELHHARANGAQRSEEHTSELQSLMRISYAVFCLKKKKKHTPKD